MISYISSLIDKIYNIKIFLRCVSNEKNKNKKQIRNKENNQKKKIIMKKMKSRKENMGKLW